MAAGRRLEHGAEGIVEPGRVLKNLVLFFSAPLIGLIYVVTFPIVGFAVLIKTAVRM